MLKLIQVIIDSLSRQLINILSELLSLMDLLFFWAICNVYCVISVRKALFYLFLNLLLSFLYNLWWRNWDFTFFKSLFNVLWCLLFNKRISLNLISISLNLMKTFFTLIRKYSPIIILQTYSSLFRLKNRFIFSLK